MNADVVRHLRCPVCAAPLATAGTAQALRCPGGHSFDIAKQGYVNLTVGRSPHSGDTAEMVAAREEFLGAGHYDFISVALTESALTESALTESALTESALTDAAPSETTLARTQVLATAPVTDPDSHYMPLVVDAGAGTGRHLGAVLDALPTATGLALDVSKPALRRAARAHPRASAALCDTWGRLPLADRATTLLLNVFAPRNGAEFRRVLRPNGALLVVTPAADHLAELVDRLGLLRVDPGKADRLASSLAGHFTLHAEITRRRALQLTRAEVHTLVGMGPSAWHTEPTRLTARIGALPEQVVVTASVRIAVYRPR